MQKTMLYTIELKKWSKKMKISCIFSQKNVFLCLFLLFSVFLCGCTATNSGNRQNCEYLNDNVRVCKDLVHKDHCRLHIERKDPYPSTVTDKFLCADTGFLGYGDRDDVWTERYIDRR